MKAKLTKIGNSLWVLIPKVYLKGKKRGDYIDLVLEPEEKLNKLKDRLDKLERLIGGQYG